MAVLESATGVTVLLSSVGVVLVVALSALSL